MKKESFAFRLRAWFNNLPIQDPVERRMASLLQVILIGLIALILFATMVLMAAPGLDPKEKLAALTGNFFGFLVVALPLSLLRRGYFRSSALIIITILFITPALTITVVFDLPSSAGILIQFTLAIILSGLLVSRRMLALVFGLSAALVAFSAFQGQSAEPRLARLSMETAINFILFNGLIALFLDHFGITLRTALTDALARETEFQSEITERRQAETALSLSEQRANALIENSWDAIALFGVDGTILYGSPSTSQILGYELDEFVGRNAFELIHPEDQALVTERMTLSLQQPGAHIPIYARVRHKNGAWRWLEGVFTNLLHEPSVQAIVNNYHDFTERQLADEVIKGSEERFRLIVEAAPSAIIAVDGNGKIDLINAKAQELFGYRQEELLGRPVEMLVPERFRTRHPNYRQSFVAKPSRRAMGAGRDLFGLHKDGHEIPIEIGLTPYESSEGSFTLALIVDITERKQVQEKVAYQAYLLENVNDAVIGSDKNSYIRFWNRGAERMLGWKAEEVLGRSGREILRSEYLNADRETVLKILAEQGRWKGESILYRKDGSPVIMEVSSITLRDINGMITGYVSVNRDITERKQAEADLYKSEELLRLGYDTAKLGIWQNNLVTGMVHFDERARAQYGFDAENVPLADVIARVHPEDIDRLGQEIATATDPAGDGRYGTEYRVIHLDGSVHWLAVQARVYFQAEGNSRRPVTGFGTSQDITERKLAEEQLHKNATRTQALADISRTLVAVRLDFQAVLDATARHTTEFIGDACSIRLISDDGQWLELASLYHPEPKTLAFLREILGTNPLRTDTGSVAQIIQTGRPMLIPVLSPEQLRAIVPATAWSILEHISIHSLLTVPLRAQGGVLGTLTLTRDHPEHPYTSEDEVFLQDLADRAALSIANARLYTATQQLNNELEQRVVERTAALSQANSLLQMLLDNMPDQIYFKDAQSRFIRNSRSQAKALGLSDPTEAVGKSDFDFFPHAQLSFEKEQEIIRSGRPLVDEEEHVVWPDGRETWVSTTKVPLPDQTGQVIGTFGISRDITERKRAEAALQKAKLELEAANRELEAFSYSVSHDLRSPLRTIDGFSQALLEDYGDQLPAEGQNHLRRVRAATQRMGQLIDDLLNLSKVTRAPMKLVLVDLSGLVQGIAAELQRTQPERRVNFKITPNLKARGDPNLMQAALENLVNNAWKFTAKREQAQIEFGSKPENDETVYFIRDNGAGFDMAYVGKLFGAFQRLHAMTEFSGTGIGLATVQRIISRHGGRIWAEGLVDQGATFFFTLPALERPKPETLPQEKDSLAKRAKEII